MRKRKHTVENAKKHLTGPKSKPIHCLNAVGDGTDIRLVKLFGTPAQALSSLGLF